jgi:hypothetical protein
MKMKYFLNMTLPILVILALVITSSGCQPSIPVSQTPASATDAASPSASNIPPPVNIVIPYELVSQESLFAYLEDLTSIQPYSGWRNSASSGEADALDYVQGKLGGFSNLQAGGLELERQSFKVYLSTEIWDSGLTLTINGQEFQVPAEGLRGNRFDRQLAVYFDSDGTLNDSNLDPVTASGAPLIVLDEDTLYSLTKDDLKGRILILAYSLIDRVTNIATSDGRRIGAVENTIRMFDLVDQGLAGLVLVTQYSNESGETRGSFAGEGSNFSMQVPFRRIPILYVRFEDLDAAGVTAWEHLQNVETAQLTLDADVFSPGTSGNLIARIPGADSSRAVILGAHIDSPNTPGVFDDGSGSAALLEVARVLDTAQIQPPVDVYLAWFGGHEIGTYGSAHFASTHQELLDRTLGMVIMDGLGRPMEGKTSEITMMLTSYGRFGDERLPLPDLLSNAVAAEGVSLDRFVEYGLIADNSNFDAFNVPNIFLGYLNADDWASKGSTYNHYSNHWHDPYETVEVARAVGPVLVDMTKVLLAAALEIGRIQPDLRVAPAEKSRALFVASHTETYTLVTAMMRDFSMALTWEGFDVDLIPYGQAITLADLKDVGILVLPPTANYPGNPTEKWSESELALLEGYVADGGLLMVVNSANNFALSRPLDMSNNNNARSLNALLEPMGIKFIYGGTGSDSNAFPVSAEHPLTLNASYLTFEGYNAVAFKMTTGLELVRSAGHPIVALVDYGELGGQVLVIGELGILLANSDGAKNLELLKNIAHYASTR